MLLTELIIWWYKDGWLRLGRTVMAAITNIERSLSVPLLLTTLFSPWRRVISGGGRTIGDKLRAVLDNLISRVVGFAVRSLVILTAVVGIVVVSLVGVVAFVCWPLAPLLAIGLIIAGVTS